MKVWNSYRQRLTDDMVAYLSALDAPMQAGTGSAVLAREVQASRKLIADLRVEHEYRQGGLFDHCVLCGVRWPCPTIRLIDEAGL